MIRRVHAVYSIPVKEEDEDEEDASGQPSTQSQHQPRPPTSPKKRTASRTSNASTSRSRTGRGKKQQPALDSGSEDEEEYGEQDYEDDGEVDEDADGDYVEPRAARSGARRKNISRTGAQTGRSAEDEEDELIMGAEVSSHSTSSCSPLSCPDWRNTDSSKM